MIPTLDEAHATTRRGLAITAVALAGVAAVIGMALLATPTEVRQGMAQKIFYLLRPRPGRASWRSR